MSTKKAISTSFVAIFILIITQIIAQSIASMFVIIKIPTGICNIIAGIIYVSVGSGLIRCSGNIVPFENTFPKNTDLYKLMTTKPGES